MITPLRTLLVIEAASPEATTQSGIILTPRQDGRRNQETGTVLAAGPEASLKVGSKVLFKRYAADEVELEGKKCLIVDETDVTGVVD
jgi:co-chaperonin GroES (HSP10)